MLSASKGCSAQLFHLVVLRRPAAWLGMTGVKGLFGGGKLTSAHVCAGMHYGYGQQVVMSYEREPLVLGGSVAMMERSGSGSTNPSSAHYLQTHRIAKVCIQSLSTCTFQLACNALYPLLMHPPLTACDVFYTRLSNVHHCGKCELFKVC